MKRKSKKQADDLLEIIEDEPEKEEIKSKKPDTKPFDTKAYIKFVKCIYNSPVNVGNAPSGTEYKFQPGQTLPVRNPEDFHHLMSLKRNPGPGCCGGSNAEPRLYFDEVIK